MSAGLCGVDEAGRGPLAGSVFAAAVILDPARPIAGLADSKVLSEAKRNALALEIREKALAYCIASASAAEIDQINILQATFLAMRRAVDGLGCVPTEVQVDGNRAPPLSIDVVVTPIVKGDAKVAEISAASILAKTARDAELVLLDQRYPLYGFAQHKGYPTAAHFAALAAHGPCPEHRKTFGPVKRWLEAHQGELF